MEALSYYRVGRTTLPRGAPLRVAVAVRSDQRFLERYRQGGYTQPSLLLVPSETTPEEEHAAEPFSFEPSRSSEDGRFLFEVPTEAFGAKPFGLLIQVSNEERVQFGEEIWILEWEDYESLLREWSEEEFLPSPGLRGGRAVATYVEGLIHQRLIEDNFGVDNSYVQSPKSMSEGIADHTFPSSPIHWATEQVLDAFREVALFGVKDVSWTVELTRNRYGLRCKGDLLDPMSDATVEDLLGEGGNHLLSLAFKDLPGMDVRWEIRTGSRRFSLAASHGIDGFPIEVDITASRKVVSPTLSAAHLPGADLQGANLRGVNVQEEDLLLRGADLQGANLEGANLQGVDLRGAILRRANLRGANLSRADLWGADLRGANLEWADFQSARLLRTYLQKAHLRGANLQGANLRETYLQEADLQEANLEGADLWRAYLSGAELKGAIHLTQEQLEQAAMVPHEQEAWSTWTGSWRR